MEQKLDLILKKLNEFDNIKQQLQTLNQRVETIETEQQEMKIEQQQIKQAVMETNESMKRLEQIQVDQQRIIELLSARSIQHEAELKRIK